MTTDPPSLGGFERRLLAVLTREVEARAAAAPVATPRPSPARRRGLPLLVAGAVAAGAVATAGATGLLPGADPGKSAVERAPGAAGPVVAADGPWRLRATPRADGGSEAQVAGDGLAFGFTVAADGGPIQASGGPGVLAGRVSAPRARGLVLRLEDGSRRRVALAREGWFVVALRSGERPVRLEARDGHDRPVAAVAAPAG